MKSFSCLIFFVNELSKTKKRYGSDFDSYKTEIV